MEWGECWLQPPPLPRALAAEVKQQMGGILPTVGHLHGSRAVGRAGVCADRPEDGVHTRHSLSAT